MPQIPERGYQIMSRQLSSSECVRVLWGCSALPAMLPPSPHLYQGCNILNERNRGQSLQRVMLRPYFACFRILICSFRADGQILVSVATKAASKGSPNLNVVLMMEDSGGTCRYNFWDSISGACCPVIFIPCYFSDRRLLSWARCPILWNLRVQ
jgi:hypothetical protein